MQDATATDKTATHPTKRTPMIFSRLLHCVVLFLTLGLTPLAAQTTAARDHGLTMVPPRCFDDNRREINIENLVVMYNRIATFSLDNLVVRSELNRGTINVRYAGDNSTSLFNPLEVAHYNADDVRIYHGTLNGHAVVIWETTVINVVKRAGILGYRGHGLYSICNGNIRPEGLDRIRGQKDAEE